MDDNEKESPMSIYALGQLRAQINVWISFRNGKVPPRSDLALALRRLPRISRKDAKELEKECKGKLSSKISAALEPPSKKKTTKTTPQVPEKNSTQPKSSHNAKSKSKVKVKREPGGDTTEREKEIRKSTIRANLFSCSSGNSRDILPPEGHLRLISSIPKMHKDRFLEFQQRIIRDIVIDFKLAAGLQLCTPRLSFSHQSLFALWKRWAPQDEKAGLEADKSGPGNEAGRSEGSQKDKVLGKRKASKAKPVPGPKGTQAIPALMTATEGLAALKASWAERKTIVACQRKKRDIEAFVGDVIRQREKIIKVAEAKAEARHLVCQKVMEFHEERKKAYEEEQLKLQRQKVELLRNNDMEGYLKLVKNMKSERVQNLLKETENHLQHIAGRIASVRQQKGHLEGQEEGAETDAGEFSAASDHLEAERAYMNMMHKKSEVVKQPSLLSGGQLREYQRDGLQWLASLHGNGLNGILADEMGLGKTVQVIALLCYLVEVKKIPGPFLIVAPASVLPNWVAEFARWAPSLRLSRYSGLPEKRAAIFSKEINPWTRLSSSAGSDSRGEAQSKWLEERGAANVVVTTYEMLMGKFDRPRLIRVAWEYVVLDEGHRIKSAECKLNAHLKSYKSSHRLLLSGTPIQNNLEELWSLLNFLLPSVFNCASDFASWFSQPLSHVLPKKAGANAAGSSTSSEQEDVLGEEERLLLINRLHQVLRPFVLRRLKHKVASELPKRLERRIPCAASAYQQWLIQQVLQHQEPEAGSTTVPANSVYNMSLPVSKKRSAPSIMNPLMEQRGICNHPFLSVLHTKEMEEKLPSGPLPPLLSTCGKLETLHRVLHKLHAAKHKVLLFCTMTRLLDIVEEYIEGQRKAHEDLRERNEQRRKVQLEQAKQQQEKQEEASKQRKGKSKEAKVNTRQQRVTRRQQQIETEQAITPPTETETADPSGSTAPASKAAWNYYRLDGSTSGTKREEMVREFNNPDSDVFIFLLSVRAGGVGINLQAADTVIMYDTDWNPQIDLQAQARAHRIGQKNEVLVIRLETMGTVEQRVRTAADRKLGLANQSITAGFFDNQTSAAERQTYLETLLRTEEQGEEEVEATIASPGDKYCPLAISDTYLNNLLARSEGEKAVFAEADMEREIQERETWLSEPTAQDSSQISCSPDTVRLTRRLLGPASLQKLVQRMCETDNDDGENPPADADEELGRGKRRRTSRPQYDDNAMLRGEE